MKVDVEQLNKGQHFTISPRDSSIIFQVHYVKAIWYIYARNNKSLFRKSYHKSCLPGTVTISRMKNWHLLCSRFLFPVFPISLFNWFPGASCFHLVIGWDFYGLKFHCSSGVPISLCVPVGFDVRLCLELFYLTLRKMTTYCIWILFLIKNSINKY